MTDSLDETFLLPEHLEHLRPNVARFMREHPIYDRNVFLMMSFKREHPLPGIHRAIANALKEADLHCIRADEKTYNSDLLHNIYVHALGCKLGIAVYEDLLERNYNPNIAFEVGFMLALGKEVLFLKEGKLPAMPTDITGRLYSSFNVFDSKSIKAAIKHWLSGLDLKPLPQKERVVDQPQIAEVLKAINHLRSYLKSKPETDDEVLRALKDAISNAGLILPDEQRSIPSARDKRARPDLSSHSHHLAIKVKLCKSVDQIRSIIEGIVADIPVFKSRFNNVIFVIYDLGYISVAPYSVVLDPTRSEGVHLVVIRH